MSADLQDRIQANKLPPELPEAAEVLFALYMQERVQAIALPPEFGPMDAAQGQAAKQPFAMSASKEQLTVRNELSQTQEAEQVDVR